MSDKRGEFGWSWSQFDKEYRIGSFESSKDLWIARADLCRDMLFELQSRRAPTEAAKPEAGLSEAKEWLVWSNEHKAWWRPNRCGYTTQLAGAGLYTEAEADKCCESRSRSEGELPPEVKEHISKISVDAGTLGERFKLSAEAPSAVSDIAWECAKHKTFGPSYLKCAHCVMGTEPIAPERGGKL